MILACPNCGSKFRVGADSLGPRGRRVRCSSCSHVWFQTPEPDAEPEAQPAPAPQVRDGADAPDLEPLPRGILPIDDEEDDRPRRIGAGRVFGWVLWFAAVGGLIGGGWYGREQVTEAWPPAASLYQRIEALLGAPPASAGAGLRFSGQSVSAGEAEGMRRLTVRGRIVNDGDRVLPVPLIEARLVDAGGVVLGRRLFPADLERLEPGGDTLFEQALDDPTGEATGVLLGLEAPP